MILIGGLYLELTEFSGCKYTSSVCELQLHLMCVLNAMYSHCVNFVDILRY